MVKNRSMLRTRSITKYKTAIRKDRRKRAKISLKLCQNWHAENAAKTPGK